MRVAQSVWEWVGVDENGWEWLAKYPIYSVYPYAEFNSDVHFFHLRAKYPIYSVYLLWANFVRKLKIVCLGWNFLPRLFRIWRS